MNLANSEESRHARCLCAGQRGLPQVFFGSDPDRGWFSGAAMSGIRTRFLLFEEPIGFPEEPADGGSEVPSDVD